MIIAIDGPAASGKGTLARRIADHFGLNHLDTGLIYRAVGAAMIDRGIAFEDVDAAVAMAKALDLGDLDREALSRHEIGDAASRIAVIPAVRDALIEAQRRFAATPPGAVLDGRDIGTVVCPDADVKLFVIATVEVRARRRTDEMVGRSLAADYDSIVADLKARDERDINRAVAPLRPATDAHLLDTSDLDIEAAFHAAVDLIDSALQRRD